jgi:hypothetical protein
MVAALRALRDTLDQLTQAQKSATVGTDVIGNDGPPPLQPDLPKGLTPKSTHSLSAEERHFPRPAFSTDSRLPQPPRGRDEDGTICHRPDHEGGNIPRIASTFQAPNRKAVTYGPSRSSPAFAGPFGLSEESLVRLEAGLRAQRERLIARPAQLAAGPECSSDDSVAYHEPDEFDLPCGQAAPLAPEPTSRLPRVAQLAPVARLTLPDKESHVQFPAAIEPSSAEQSPMGHLSSPPATTHARHLQFSHFIIATVMAFFLLLPCTVPLPELESVPPEAFGPAQSATIQQNNAPSVEATPQVDSLLGNNSVPPKTGSKLQAATMISVPARP